MDVGRCPHAYHRAQVQVVGPACARGPYTGHDAVFTGTRQTQPTKIVTFPRNKAEKSLQNQHVLSILQVGSHQLQYRFFRTNKPKSRHKTNTFCPLTLVSYNPYNPAISRAAGPSGARNTSGDKATQQQVPQRRTQAYKKPTSGSDVGLWWS